MKFTTTFTIAGLAAIAAALPQADSATAPANPGSVDGSTITAAPTQTASISIDPVYSSVLNCISSCSPGDVYCQADCQGLPTPDETAVNATYDCVAACPPGGDDEKNAAWAACQQKCVTELYWTASQAWTVATLPTGTLTDADDEATATGTGSETATRTGGSNAEETPESGSETSASPSASETPNAANIMLANMPMLGALGLFLGALAL
ncbi:hypothetical protein ABW19_dt0200796 [Dactylella cylindrospora]|nr:hypothetical protein ABW19_dt0200796 [Dactylella cylindrospora]